jgi:hypothetical protein
MGHAMGGGRGTRGVHYVQTPEGGYTEGYTRGKQSPPTPPRCRTYASVACGRLFTFFTCRGVRPASAIGVTRYGGLPSSSVTRSSMCPGRSGTSVTHSELRNYKPGYHMTGSRVVSPNQAVSSAQGRDCIQLVLVQPRRAWSAASCARRRGGPPRTSWGCPGTKRSAASAPRREPPRTRRRSPTAASAARCTRATRCVAV